MLPSSRTRSPRTSFRPTAEMLGKIDAEEGRLLPKPPQTPRDSPARGIQPARVAGALVRTYGDDDDTHSDHDEPSAALRSARNCESDSLIETTRVLFSTLLAGHSSLMNGNSAIETEISRAHSHSRDLHQSAQGLQACIDILEEKLERAAERELQLHKDISAAHAKSQHAGDADELARRIDEQLQLATTIQTVLADTESASMAHKSAAAGALAGSKRQCKELKIQLQTASERTQKISKMLDAEKEKARASRKQLTEAEDRNKVLARQVHDLEMQLQTKTDELELMFQANEARRQEQRRQAEHEGDKRGELEDKVSDLRSKVESLQESREKLKIKIELLAKELKTATEVADTKWNEENWAKQVFQFSCLPPLPPIHQNRVMYMNTCILRARTHTYSIKNRE